jgi:hypothetical protein
MAFKLELSPFMTKDLARQAAIEVEKQTPGLTAQITEIPDVAPAPDDESKVDDLSDPTGEKQMKTAEEALIPADKRG